MTAAARGEGIGTLPTRHCRARLRTEGIGHWSVTAIAANLDAVRLYEREGFEILSHNLPAPIRQTSPT